MFLRAFRACLLLTVFAAIAGCQFSPSILAAQAENEGEEVTVKVILASSDAETIKDKQLYFSIVVANCSSSEGFPMEPYIAGERASEFSFSAVGASVEVVGRVPARVFHTYRPPCAFLRGGGYFTGTIQSAPVAIEMPSGRGPSN